MASSSFLVYFIVLFTWDRRQNAVGETLSSILFTYKGG